MLDRQHHRYNRIGTDENNGFHFYFAPTKITASIFTSHRRKYRLSIFTSYRHIYRFQFFLSIEVHPDSYDDFNSVFFQSKFIPIHTTMISIPSSFNRSSFRFTQRCSFRFLSIEVHPDSYDDFNSVFF